MSVYIASCKLKLASIFSEEEVTSLIPKSFCSGRLDIDEESPYYPVRGDQKLMRSDTKAAVVLVQELLQEFPNLNKEEMALFVASGVFIEHVEKHLGHLTRAFENIIESKTDAEKLAKIYRSSPPLLALQTLTNSTMSFVAQYSGVKGNNATFGNTSLSGFHALKEGVEEVKHYGNDALALSSNVAGEYSFLVNSTLLESNGMWKESAGVGAVLISNEKQNAVCEVLRTEIIKESTQLDAEVIIHSGAFTDEADQKDKLKWSGQAKKNISGFEKFGNMGPTNIMYGLQLGIEELSNGIDSADIIDKDIYGRISRINWGGLKDEKSLCHRS